MNRCSQVCQSLRYHEHVISSMRTEQINVSLTPELARFVKAKIKTGMYNNVSEFMRELVRDRQERERIRGEVQNQLGKGLAAGTITTLQSAGSTIAAFGIEDDVTMDAVREGLLQIERGMGIEVRGEAELSNLFADVIARGKTRVQSASRKVLKR